MPFPRIFILCMTISNVLLGQAKADPSRHLPSSRWRDSPAVERTIPQTNQRLKIIHRSIAVITRKIQQANIADAARFELTYRLAQLLLEKADLLDQLLVHQAKPARQGSSPDVVLISQKQALQSFNILLKQYPTHPRIDLVAFDRAQLSCRLNAPECERIYTDFIQTYPASSRIAAAHLEFAELKFDRFDFRAAFRHFGRAASDKAYPGRYYARYKQAWSAFNTEPQDEVTLEQQRQIAIDLMMGVVSSVAASSSRHDDILKEDAANDLLTFWSEGEKFDAAFAFYPQHFPQAKALELLSGLGDRLASRGNHRGALSVYERRLSAAPWSKQNPQIMLKVAEAQHRLGWMDKLARTYERSIRATEMGGRWAEANGMNAFEVGEVQALLRAAIFTRAQLIHQATPEGKAIPKDFGDSASELYQLVMKAFPQSEEAAASAYYLSGLVYDTQGVRSALPIIRRVAEGGSKYKIQAVETLLDWSIDLALSSLTKGKKPARASGSVNPETKLAVEVFDRFHRMGPGPKQSVWAFQVAELFRLQGAVEASILRYQQVIDRFPGSVQSGAAIEHIAQLLESSGQWSELELHMRRLQPATKSLKPTLQSFVQAKIRLAAFNSAIDLEQREQYNLAASKFASYAEEFQSVSHRPDVALYNAAVNFENASSPDEALAKLRLLIKRYPRSSVAPQTLLSQARIEESLFDFRRASFSLLLYAKAFENSPEAYAAARSSARLAVAAGDLALAEDALDAGFRLASNPEIQVEVLLAKIQLQVRSGNCSSAESEISRVMAITKGQLNQFPLEARANIAAALLRCGLESEGMREAATVAKSMDGGKGRISGDLSRQLSGALFSVAEKVFSRYSALKFDPASAIIRQVEDAQAKLVESAQYYQLTMSLGDADYVHASMNRILGLHRILNQALKTYRSGVQPVSAQQQALLAALDEATKELDAQEISLAAESKKFADDHQVISNSSFLDQPGSAVGARREELSLLRFGAQRYDAYSDQGGPNNAR